MRPPVAVVYLKELKDSLRDRRTALMVFVASILTGPVTLVLMAHFITGLEEKAAIRKVRIAGQQFENAVSLWSDFWTNATRPLVAKAAEETKRAKA